MIYARITQNQCGIKSISIIDGEGGESNKFKRAVLEYASRQTEGYMDHDPLQVLSRFNFIPITETFFYKP